MKSVRNTKTLSQELVDTAIEKVLVYDNKDIDKLVDKVVKENLSARRVEKLVQDYKNPVIKNTPVISEAAQEYQKQLRHYLQTRVKIDGSKISINYVDEVDLERIVNDIIKARG